MTTVLDVQRFKTEGRRFAMLTAYDATMAALLDAAEIPVLLVGDSLGMVTLGYSTTVPVTLDDMVHHAAAVARGAGQALLVGDLPFGAYQESPEQARARAARLLKEGGMHAVKLEGGAHMAGTVRRLVENGIPVMAHIGLTPQSVNAMGGYRVQGKTPGAAEQLLRDARAVEAAGAFAIVLEGIPREVAAEITRSVRIPTIGIGAGPDCDGQILVLHDVLGLTFQERPKFARRYANIGDAISQAVREYCADVQSGSFPSDAESYHSPASVAMKARKAMPVSR